MRKKIVGFKNKQKVLEKNWVKPEQLEENVGKDVAKKLLETPRQAKINERMICHVIVILEGQDLRVGGEGMRSYYDKIVPTQLAKIVKRLDPQAKIGI